jgi:hypothetical protein
MACQHPRPPAGIVAMTGLQWILLATGAMMDSPKPGFAAAIVATAMNAWLMSRPGGAAATWAAVKG